MKTVIEMAREAGWKDLREYDSQMQHDFFMGNTDSLKRFAELVRADERAKMAEQPAQQGPVAAPEPRGLIDIGRIFRGEDK